MGLIDVIRALGGAVARPFVDEQPILRERTRRDWLTLPGPGGTSGFAGPIELATLGAQVAPPESDEYYVETPAGDFEEVGSRKVPSALSRGIKGALPSILRGGIIAASSPTRGQVGTAGDIFGALRNVMADRDQQDMIEYNMRRQNRMDAERSQMHQAQMDRYAADAERDRAMADRARGVNSQTMADQYADFMRVAIDQYGMTIPQANAAWAKQYNPADKPVAPPRTIEENWARILSDPKATSEEKQAAQQAYTEAQKARQRPPFLRPITAQTAEGLKVILPERMPDGALETRTADVPFQRPTQVRPPAAAPRQRQMTPAQARAAQINQIASKLLAEAGGDVSKALQAAAGDPRASQFLTEITGVLRKIEPRKKQGSLADLFSQQSGQQQQQQGQPPANPSKKKRWIFVDGQLKESN